MTGNVSQVWRKGAREERAAGSRGRGGTRKHPSDGRSWEGVAMSSKGKGKQGGREGGRNR